ncbi:hypothetical protein VCR6J2_250135 [Vibrio coralliirubri]|nr:hypothetical protein VCR6J2_250135 [Vibrio coralliirubri]
MSPYREQMYSSFMKLGTWHLALGTWQGEIKRPATPHQQ